MTTTEMITTSDHESALPTATSGESVAAAAARAGAITEMQALFALAVRFPRNLEALRQNLLRECADPVFAEQAVYSLRFGGGDPVRGPSIRFAEAVMRYLENAEISSLMVADTPSTQTRAGSRTWRVTMADYQYRRRWSHEVTIDKTVERRNAAGRTVYSSRPNSDGHTVFIVSATDAELLAKENSAISKAQRNLIVKWLDRSILADAQEAIARTNENSAAQNPEQAKRDLIDGFGGIGIPVGELERYCGQSLSTLVPKQVAELRELYVGLRDGHVTWLDCITERGLAPDDGGEDPPPQGVSVLQRIRAKKGDAPTKDARPAPAAAPQEAPREAAPAQTASAPTDAASGSATKKRRELIAEINLLLKAGHKASVDAAVAKVGKAIAKMTDEELERVVLVASEPDARA